MRPVLLAAVPLALLAAVPAAASSADFTFCDGYPAPTKKVDGMSKGTWLFGLASRSEDIRRGQTVFGANVIPSCDAALADPLLLPQYWLRRAHLLQAKATHQIDAGDAEGALATLAASDALAPAGDPFFERSVLLGNRALRAVADFKLGKRDAALAELDAIDKARPYAAIVRQLTLSIRLANESDRDAQRRLLKDNARLSPGGFPQLFWVAMYYSDFRAAAELGQEVTFDLPHGRDDRAISGYQQQQYEAIGKRAEIAAARAYALAAIGDAEGSRAAIAGAEADIAEEMAPLPPLAPGDTYKKSVIADHERRLEEGRAGTQKIETWKALIALRARAGTLTLQTLRAEINVKEAESTMVLPDLLSRVQLASPAETATRDAVVKTLYGKVDAILARENQFPMRELVKLLPRPETAAMVPVFKSTGDGYFLSDLNGFYVKREKDSDYINIRYGGYLTNRATIEELALLAAAQQAQKAGKDSLLLDSRMFIERSLTTYGMYGINYGTSNNGYEARLRLLPVNANALPADLAHSGWRLIRVGDVEAALGDLYRRPAPAR